MTATSKIALTQGYSALVSDEDYERVSQYNWHAQVRPHTVYAARSLRNPDRKQYLHQFILDTTHVDHKDGNGLNCCRDNLRLATHRQNMCNALKQGDGFRGVRQVGQRFIARINDGEGGKRNLGTYDSAEEAAKAYDRAAIELQGEYAILNFEDQG